MIYRYSASLDSRFRRSATIGGILAVLMVGAALIAAARGATIVGLLILIGVALIAYKLRSIVKGHLESWIQTDDDGITCRTPSGDDVKIDWASLTHAGLIYSVDGERFVYMYSSGADRFVCVPTSFQGVDDLYTELSERAAIEDITLRDGESAADGLQRTLTTHQAE